MASGTITGTTYISGHYWIELVWTDSIVNTTTSSVTVKTYFCSDWSASYSADKNGTTVINGTSQSWSSPTDVSHSNGAVQKTLVHTSTSQSVTHNADGTKSITISGTYSPNIDIVGYGTLGTMSASGTAVLSDTNGTEYIPTINVWNGTSWVHATHLYVWDGGSWVHSAGLKVWSGGASWVNSK
jgi:hypothetical protein